MVRLKVFDFQKHIVQKAYFNSKMVRLKVITNQAQYDPIKFQFQNGTIKRRP